MTNHGPARWSGAGTGKRSVQARDTRPRTSRPTAAASEPEPEVERTAPDATDAAKALAAEHGIELATVTGTGADGRITKDDVAAIVEGRQATAEDDKAGGVFAEQTTLEQPEAG